MDINLYTASYETGNVNKIVAKKEVCADKAKYMETVEKGEKVNLFQEGKESVIMEISKEGMEELDKRILSIKNDNPHIQILSDEEKLKLLQEAIKPARKLHRIIPNIQTNDKLGKSLKGADENVADAAYSIIENNLIPHNVGALTEEERQELILVGLEEAKYLAGSLENGKAGLFMEAMNTIAKYGINGQKDSEGNVTYDIRWGAMVGAPDDYISTGEMMRRIDPESYRTFSEMQTEGIEKDDNGLIMKAMKFFINWEQTAYRKNPTSFEEEKKKQVDWKKGVEAVKIKNTYGNTDRTDKASFIDSISKQNKVLDSEYLLRNLEKFFEFGF